MIGLTGGIASGKSLVAGLLTQLGAAVLDADKVARLVVEPGYTAWQKISAIFPDVIQEDGAIDRKKLGQIVFASQTERKKLEEIIHPEVISVIQNRAAALAEQGEIVVCDIPLLFETGCEEWLGQVWVVYVDQQTQLKRLIYRDGLDEDSAWQRINAQMSIEEKRKRADKVIDNRYSVENTNEQVKLLWKEVLNEYRPHCP